MLDLAIKHKEKLNQEYQISITKKENKFFVYGQWDYFELKIDDSDYYKLQYVSVGSSGKILGYLNANIDRNSNIITSISAIRFSDSNLFSLDLFRFLKKLSEMPLKKMEWSVIKGNSAERLYDKIIHKYGGSRIGIRKESVKLKDGMYYDKVLYEIMLS